MTIIRCTPITHLTLALLIGAYLWLLSRPPGEREAAILALAADGAFDHTLLTAAFIHLNPGHLLFNLVGVGVCGVWAEYRLGPVRFLPAFVLAGAGSWLLFVLREPAYHAAGGSGLFAGAAGIAFGLSGGLLRGFILLLGTAWLLFALVQPAAGPNDVHAVGLLIGGMLGWAMAGQASRPGPLADQPR